jgi:DNA-binding SARP family transcriptional activator
MPLPPDGQAPIVICVLGRFRLVKRGKEIPVREGSKAQALLSRLALHLARGLHRESLLSAIWPEREALLAGQSLNSLVYSLRRMLGDGIEGAAPVVQDSGYYRLNLEAGIAVDLAHFQMLIEEGERRGRNGDGEGAAQAYRQAVGFYRGDLADNGDIAAVIQRERFRSIFLTTLARLADLSFQEGQYDACLDSALRLLVEDPCREDAHRLIMRCHVRLGQRAQALRQFRICEEILQTEFDAIPEPVTLILFDEIRLDPAAV